MKSFAALLAIPAFAKAGTDKKPQLLLQHSPIAGFQYYQGKKIWAEQAEGQPLTLHREADNPYDARAVAIYCHDAKLGYIPRDDNAAISQLLDRGEQLHVVIEQLQDGDNPWERILIAVSVG